MLVFEGVSPKQSKWEVEDEFRTNGIGFDSFQNPQCLWWRESTPAFILLYWVISGVTNSVRLKKYPWSFVGLVGGLLCLRLRHVYPLPFSSPHGCCLLHRFRQKSISSNTPESTMIRSNLGSEELGEIGIHLRGFHVLKNSQLQWLGLRPIPSSFFWMWEELPASVLLLGGPCRKQRCFLADGGLWIMAHHQVKTSSSLLRWFTLRP